MENQSSVLVELQYLPCVEYFAELVNYKNICLEAHENYQKQSYRNRCYILGANKIIVLTVPILKSLGKQITKNVKIDYKENWVNIHWKSIQSSYNKSPYFEYYSDLFYAVIKKKHTFLWDLNEELMTLCLDLLKCKKEIILTQRYNTEVDKEIIDLRNKIAVNKNKDNIDNKTCVHYQQMFGNKFVSNLSVIDLIFSEGSNALKIIKQGILKIGN